MTDHSQQPPPSLYSQFDVSPEAAEASPSGAGDAMQAALLQQAVSVLQRQNELLEELVAQSNAQQRQRAAELNQWKQAHPELAQYCRMAFETLSRVQACYLEKLTEEVGEHADLLADGEFMLTEFVDRFGPRLAHLNGMLQVLSQLAAQPQ